MESAFGVVLFVVVFLGAIAAVISFLGSSELYDKIGRGGIVPQRGQGRPTEAQQHRFAVLHRRRRRARRRDPPALAARNERRSRRGEEPLDVEAELQRLTAPAVDAGLREEVRSLVVARNERRVRRGGEPLDVEAEVARRLDDLAR